MAPRILSDLSSDNMDDMLSCVDEGRRVDDWIARALDDGRGNPRQFKVSDWFLNRKDYKDDRFLQVIPIALNMKLREDLESLMKIMYYFFSPLSPHC